MSERIEIDIEGVSDAMRWVSRIEYAEAFDRLDALVVEFAAGHRASDDDALTGLGVGGTFTVKLMRGTSVVSEGSGDLVEVTHERRARGPRRVRAVGVDGLHRLRGQQPAKVWEASHSDIVSELARKYGLSAQADGVDTTEGFEFQPEVSDGVFLRNLAREHNYFVRVADGKLHFARREGRGADVTVGWGPDVLEVRTRMSLTDMVTKVTVHGYDMLQDALLQGQAAPSDLKKITGSDTGVGIVQQKFGESELILNQSGYVAQSNAKARAVAELQARAERFLSGTLLVRGNPGAVSGRKLTVEDAEWPFNGTFLIRQTRHVQDAALGYRTWIDFVSDSMPARSS